MATDDKKSEAGQAETQGAAGEPEAGPAAGDSLAGLTSAVAGEVPAGLGGVEPEPVEAEPAEPKPSEPRRVETRPVAADEPLAASAAEPSRTAASPWAGAEADGRERPAPAAPPPPPRPAPVVGSGGGGRGFLAGILGSLLLLALAGAAAFLTRDLWAPRLAATLAPAPQAAGTDAGAGLAGLKGEADALKAEVADLRTQIAARDQRLSGVETKLEGLGQQVEQVAAAGGDAAEAQPAVDPQPAVPDLSQPVADLDQRLSRLEDDLQRLSGMEQGLAGMQTAVSEVQSEVRTAVDRAEQQASRPAATVLAINQLADALGRTDGYARQLEAVGVIAGGNAALAEPLDRLAAWSASGLASLGQLQGEFPAIAQKVAQTGYQSGGEGWLDDVTNRLTSLVTVRRVGDAALAAGGSDAALAQAEAALRTGDLAGAVKALDGLQGQAAEAVSSWLAKARDRVAAEQALADLRLAAIAQLDAARG